MPIPFDAKAEHVKAALEGLTTLDVVDVTRSEQNAAGGYSWSVSFGPSMVGNQQLFTPESAGLRGSLHTLQEGRASDASLHELAMAEARRRGQSSGCPPTLRTT